MLHTQFSSAASGFGAFGDETSVRALQETLRRLGNTSISVSGKVDGPTAAAVYELIRDHASLIPKIPSSVKTVFDKLKGFDSTLRQYTCIVKCYDTSSLIRYSSTVLSIVRGFSSSAADAMQRGLNEFFAAINATAPALNVAFNILAPTSPTSPSTTAVKPAVTSIVSALPVAQFVMQPTTAAPAAKPGTIYAFSKKLGMYRIAVPRGMASGLGVMESGLFGDCIFGDCGLGAVAPFIESAPSPTPPAGGIPVTETDLEKKTGTLPLYKKWQFWTAVGGGVVVVGTGTALLVRRKRSA